MADHAIMTLVDSTMATASSFVLVLDNKLDVTVAQVPLILMEKLALQT